MGKDLLGILVNDSLIQGIQRGNTGHEKLDYYQSAGKKFNLIPCYFRLQDVSSKNRTANALIEINGVWYKKRIPLPSVIHNRSILHTKKDVQKLRKLTEKGVQIYNQWNRYSKLYISSLLYKQKEFHMHLPATYSFSSNVFKVCHDRFLSLLLKPDKGTVGQGIIRLDKTQESEWQIKRKNGKTIEIRTLPEEDLYKKLKHVVGKEKYLVQETIPLATYQGSPFDIRVSVQKGADGKWGITGMVGKVARKGHFLSNVAQGGRVVKLEHILQEEYPALSADKVRDNISSVSLAFTQYLDSRLPHLADIGYDFGIDTSGKPYFIEMNSRDQRYSFALANMKDTWKKTYENPVAYGRYLLDRSKEQEAWTTSEDVTGSNNS